MMHIIKRTAEQQAKIDEGVEKDIDYTKQSAPLIGKKDRRV